MEGSDWEKWLWVVNLVLVLLLGGLVCGCEGCLEQEKVALLQLKPFFYLHQDPYNSAKRYSLYNWVEENSDCCKWESVECDPTTGRVTTLSLTDTLLLRKNALFDTHVVDFSLWDENREPWYLNASLFLPFEDLKTLSLSGNRIAGCFHNHGFEKLTRKLNKLKVLDLSFNHFDGSNVLTSLLEFSSLTSLDLSYNNLTGPIHTSGFEGLSKLSNLETLHLSENRYLDINSLSHLIGGLSSLKALNLEYCGLKGTIQIQEIFSNLKNLKELYLIGNEFESFGSFPEDDRESSGLINLEVLSLSLNLLNDSILSSLGPFSESLTHLSIPGSLDFIKGSINIEDARKRGLKNLKDVDLVGVQAANNRVVPQSLGLFPSLKTLHFKFESYFYDETVAIQELRNMTSLEELFVDGFLSLEYVGNLTSLRVVPLSGDYDNLPKGPLHLKNLKSLKIDGLTGTLPDFLEKIGAAKTSLKILSLSGRLNGTLSALGICELTNLEELDVSHNNLTGTLPDCFLNLTSLRHLDLSCNKLSGDLYSLMSLTSMESIDLSYNQFQIPSSLKPFLNHSKLKQLNGDHNRIFAETELYSFAPRFQLNFISLSCCGNGGTLPKFLQHQHELQHVDLSNIKLTGEFPSWLLENNTQLETLFLYNNSLSRNLKPFHSPLKLFVLDISNNFFDGYIPIEIGKYLSGLKLLNISKNSLDGGIPSSIGDMKLLQVLDLSNNRLAGVIPESMATNCSSLLYLILSNNRLHGQMFSSNFNLLDLVLLDFGGNNFTGGIPTSLANSTSLSIIDISDNHISGRIPRWLGNLSSLHEIIMPNNHIEGPIPTEFCKLMNPQLRGVLDISMNSISGKLPSACFGPNIALTDVYLSKNRVSGPIPNSLCKSLSLESLDLSHNQLSGHIPNCVDNLSELSYLVLKQNNLEGEIPNQLCQLEKLYLIDLSQNNLSGGIPHCLNITAYAIQSTVMENDLQCDNQLHRLQCDNDLDDIPPITFYRDYGSIELTTKNISYSYKGRNLRYLSGIDLSCNKLTGEIPYQMGKFGMIRVLNLSHNSLRGPIPPSFSNLTQIESLDLSYNNLSGGIPPQFVELNFLAYFNVSYNNLSGKPPPRAGQFASNIDENSYWGNPFFCGECFLPNKSSTMKPPSNSTQQHEEDEEDVGGLIEVESFWVTFGVSYMMVLLGIAAVLYINPYWRGAWFYFVERVITACFYFVIDNFLPRRFRFCYILPC